MPVIQKKVCLLGDFAVGKTSLVRYFVEGIFDDRYLSTIGVKISRRSINRPYGELNLIIWDLAGSGEFSSWSSYLRGISGALIVCDLTRRETLDGFERYSDWVRQMNEAAPLIFIGNKVDLVDQRLISDADLLSATEALGGEYFLSSAKTGEQVAASFLSLAGALDEQI